mmetsp:Transcript_97791/g.277220  ORF Transcript_97791/g.277220 Transcript_97791/m.277220 type:complete len:235 (+) Transcript_97791:666-1370(+)
MRCLYISMVSAYSGKTSSMETRRESQMTCTALVALPSEKTFQLSPMPPTRSLSARKYLASSGYTFEQPLKAVEMIALKAAMSLSVLPVSLKSRRSCVMSGARSKALSHSSLASFIVSGSSGATFSTSFQSFRWDSLRMRSESSASSSKIWMRVEMASSPNTRNSERFFASMPSITVPLYRGTAWPGTAVRAPPAPPAMATRRITERRAAHIMREARDTLRGGRRRGWRGNNLQT